MCVDINLKRGSPTGNIRLWELGTVEQSYASAASELTALAGPGSPQSRRCITESDSETGRKRSEVSRDVENGTR